MLPITGELMLHAFFIGRKWITVKKTRLRGLAVFAKPEQKDENP
jgi:hypothetical protein